MTIQASASSVPWVPQGRNRSWSPVFNRAVGRAFDVRAADGEDTAVITIYDVIGWPYVTAENVRRTLDGITAGTIVVRINSPGGDVFDGIAIHNDLQDHPAHVRVEITGLAASAASVIAMAGDDILMPGNAFLMIHNAWTISVGDSGDMAKAAGVLDQIDAAIATTYADRTGISTTALRKMMADETWLAGDAAVEKGFATGTIKPGAAEDDPGAQARFDLSLYRHAPKGLGLDADDPAPPRTIRDFERLLRDAGVSARDAKAMVSRGYQAIGGQRDAAPEGLADLVAAMRQRNSLLQS